MAKVLELESGVDPIPAEAEQDKMTDTEKVIQSLMRKSYTLGVQSGIRTMCVTVLSQLNQTKKMNPQKQLNLLKQMCMRNIENQNKAAQSTENPTTETTTNN
jgi:hypothetical protein